MFRRSYPWPEPSADDIRKRSRILVIDDGDFPYLKLFRRDGYTIEKWPDVKDLPSLENGEFDVILLDLQGVGKSLSADQGPGVLGHIRQVNPAQIVVAYSNAEWSLDYQQFFESADAVLHKSKDDYVQFKRTVDGLLEDRFDLGFYLDRVGREVSETPVGTEIVERARKAILQRNPASLKRYLHIHLEDAVTIDRVLAVVGVAIEAAQLWRS